MSERAEQVITTGIASLRPRSWTTEAAATLVEPFTHIERTAAAG